MSQELNPDHLAVLERLNQRQTSTGNMPLATQQMSTQASVPFTPNGLTIPPTPEQRAQQQEEDGGLGFFGTWGDILKGQYVGVHDAIAETVNIIPDVLNYALPEDHQLSDFMDPSSVKPETEWGKAGKSITQFAVGFIGAGKFLKAARLLQGTGKGVTFARGMTEGAIADFTVFDAHEERLSNLIESSPTLANPITEFLAANKDDSAAMGHFKNTLEGMALGVAGEALFTIVRGMKAARGAKTVAEAEDSIIHTTDELEALAAKTGQTTEELSQSVDAVISGDTQALTDALESSGGKVDLRVAGVDAGEAEAALKGLADGGMGSPAAAPAFKNIGPEEFISTKQVSKEAPHGITTGEGASSLTVEQLQKTWDEVVSSGHTLDDVMKGRYAIGNAQRIKFGTLEEAKFNAECYLNALDKSLKGKGVETHKYLLDTNQELARELGESGILDAAAKDRAAVQDMTKRLVMYKTHALYYSGKLTKVLDDIRLHGETPELLKDRAEFSKAYQELSDASQDIATAGARVTSAGRITPLIPDDKFAAIFEATGGDTEAMLRVQNLYRSGPARRFFRGYGELIINGLLSSPKTHAINIASNTLKTALMPVETILGGMWRGDKATVISGMETFAGLGTFYKEAWKYAKIAWKTGDNVLDKGSKILDTTDTRILTTYDDIARRIQEKRIISGGDPKAPLSAWEELSARTMSFIGAPSRALGTMDEFFKQLNARASTSGRLHGEAVTKFGNDTARIAEYVQQGMEDAFGAGGRGLDPENLRYAQESTFTQSLKDDAYYGGIGQGVSNLVRQYPPLRLIMPFVRTPTNLIRDFVAHTPGLNMLTKRYKDAIAAGGERAARAQGATATGLMLWGSAITLAASGKMTGGYPTDPATRQAWIDSGIEPYSFKIGDKYISFARLDPFSTFFGIAADYAEYSRNWSDSAKGNWASGAALALANNITSKSYLTGLTDLIGAATDTSVDSVKMQQFIQHSTAMFIPYSSGLRFTRQMTDDNLREVRGIFDNIKNSIPGTSHLLPVKYSWLTGKAVSNNVFWGEHKDDIVANEMARLGDNLSIGAPARKLKGVELDGEQYSRLCQLQGTVKIGGLTQHERLTKLLRSPSYDLGRRKMQDMPGDIGNPRTEMVEKIVTQYRQAAQKALLRENDTLREGADREFKVRRTARRGDVTGVKDLLTMPK